MKKFAFSMLLVFAAFLGGAAAQTIGGSAILQTVAQTVTPSVQTLTQAGTGNQGSPSGLLHPGFIYNYFWQHNDNIDSSSQGPTIGLAVELDANGGNAAGHKYALSGTTLVTGSVKSGQDGTTQDYLGVNALGQSNINVGGTDTTLANSRGAVYGAGINALLTTNATNFRNLTGTEFDVTAYTGSTVRKKSGVSITSAGAVNQVQGSVYDTALSISDASGSIGWLTGILFSDYNGKQPLAAGGSLIATAGSSTITNGINFTSYTFTGSPILMPLMTPATSGASCTTGAIEWDTGFVYICTSTNTWKRAALSTF